MSRALTTDPLAVQHSADEPDILASASRRVLASVIEIGASASVVLAGVSLLAPAAASSALLAFAVITPGVLVQDAVRFIALVGSRPRTAFVNDLGWLILQVGGIAVLDDYGVKSTWAFVAVWGGAGTFCGLLGLVQLGLFPAFGSPLHWVRMQWSLSRYYVAEGALLNGMNLVSITMIGIVAGFAASAGLRGAVALFGPLAVLSLGARAALTPEFVRLAKRRPDAVYRMAMTTSVGFVLVGTTWGGFLLLLPGSVGEAMLGETWPLSREVLVFVAIDSVAALFTVGAFIGIRASGNARRGLTARLALALPRLVVGIGAAAVYGALGAAVAFACLAPFTLAVWTYHLRRSVSHAAVSAKAAAADASRQSTE